MRCENGAAGVCGGVGSSFAETISQVILKSSRYGDQVPGGWSAPVPLMNMPATNPQSAGENAGENQPQLNVVPPAAPPRVVTNSSLTKRQRADVGEVELNAKEAQEPVYSGPMEGNGIAAAFLTTLLTDIKVVTEVGGEALGHTDSSEAATRDGLTAKKTLITDLRQMQSSGRQLHQHTNPEKMQAYLIGQNITTNRATLKTSAQTIINRTNAERGPGIDTSFIVKTTNDLAALEGKNAAQEDESIAAQNMRVDRESKVASIVQRGQTIKTAADRAWPYSNPANAGARRKFHLPENRPYVP